MRKTRPDNKWLYPSRIDQFYYHLILLRENLKAIKKKHIKSGSVIVDLGCGRMPYREVFGGPGIKYVGADLAPNPSADIFISEDGAVPLGDSSADVVLSTQVLEHVKDPMAYLRECRRILKPGGLLILSTHGYWLYHPGPEDYWRWTSAGLTESCTQAGFRVEEFKGLMGRAPAALQLLQDSLIGRVPTRVFKRIFIFVVQSFIMFLDSFYSQGSRDKDACVFLVVAKRP